MVEYLTKEVVLMKIIENRRLKKQAKKKEKQFYEKVRKEKSNINKVVEYLVDLYYYNPNEKLSLDAIKKYTNISDERLKQFIKELKNKKMIKGNKEFFLTFDGLIYLQGLERDYNEFKINGINMLLEYGGFALITFGLYTDNAIAKGISVIFAFIIIFLIGKIVPKK